MTQKPALLIIDMQNDFASAEAALPVAGAQAVITPLTQLLSCFAKNIFRFFISSGFMNRMVQMLNGSELTFSEPNHLPSEGHMVLQLLMNSVRCMVNT
jgi:nicotinamidase-related amidase